MSQLISINAEWVGFAQHLGAALNFIMNLADRSLNLKIAAVPPLESPLLTWVKVV